MVLSLPTGGAAVGVQGSAIVNIIENDSPQPGVLQFALTGYSVSEDGLNANLMVSRTGGSDGVVGMSYNSADGTATAGSDYTAVAGGAVSFADGDAVSKIITIPILDDVIYEAMNLSV